ncbi:MAG TPA: type IV toxin-antitoxin system AbiEi family antitoxin domain-containing protein [Solirubrobacteraceae bacterium]|nr:type IV toxin-antitoxin system AbiEi family antitoxin domain-containing protein [Solirubrobacteraceae bacterium]
MGDFSSTALLELVEAQHGVVTRAQLLDLGLSVGALNSRLRRGALRPMHRGVYAVAHTALREEGRWLAAVLACGVGAVLSHLSAGRLWSMSAVPVDRAVHVTVPGADRARPGIVAHRAPLTGADVTVHRGVPTTTPSRTLVDLADVLPYATLRRIADRGVRLDAGALRRAGARAPNRRGRGAIARLLGDDELRTRSNPERVLRRLARAAGLAAPVVNERVVGSERDFAWPGQRLVVEVDGHAVHAPRGAREVDHERDAELVLAGWRVLRFTADQLEHEPAGVVALLRRALAR